jgi:ABC-type branched-subunit amino acid transport system ATPase component
MKQPNNLVIETRNLSKSFGEVQGLKGVDLKVPRHSTFGFLGPNGAGKTTHYLGKLLRDRFKVTNHDLRKLQEVPICCDQFGAVSRGGVSSAFVSGSDMTRIICEKDRVYFRTV